MANLGWRPRSSSATRIPRWRSTRASSEPANPEPTMATSVSMRRRWGRASRRRHLAARVARERRRHALRQVQLREPRLSRQRSSAAQVANRSRSHVSTNRRVRVRLGRARREADRRRMLDIDQAWRRKVCLRLRAPPSRHCRRASGSARPRWRRSRTRRRSTARASVPARPAARTADAISRNTRSSTSWAASARAAAAK